MPQPFKTFADTRVMLKTEMMTDLSSACWSVRMKMMFSENEIQNAKLLTKWRRKWTLSRKWKQRAAEAPRAFSQARLWPTGTCNIAHGYGNTPRALQVSVYQLSFHKHSHTRQLQPLANPPDNYAFFFFFFVSKQTQENLTARSKMTVAKAKALNAPFPPHENVERSCWKGRGGTIPFFSLHNLCNFHQFLHFFLLA